MRKQILVLLAMSIGSAGAQRHTLLQQAPPKTRSRVNPFAGRPEAVRAGSKIYARECASCHGPTGEGAGKAPPLARKDLIEAPPGTVFWALTQGSLKRGMPSFAGLPEQQRWQVIAFLQSRSEDK